MKFSQDQELALQDLSLPRNSFLTGRAGTGKSTVLRKYLQLSRENIAILASTGAAAVIVGGRTFHSFFGLGILEGGPAKTVERALKNPRLKKRLQEVETIVVDEISLLSGETLATAEEIARRARRNEQPWGNLKVIAVGDFAQLPPVAKPGMDLDWAFLHEVWSRTELHPVCLNTIHRNTESQWNHILNKIRDGVCDKEVTEALNSRMSIPDTEEVTRLFGTRNEAENFNRFKLESLRGEEHHLETDYKGDPISIASLKKNAPVPEVLVLKEGALVMIRKNDTDGLYVNGSLGTVKEIRKNFITVELLDSSLPVEIEPVKFEMLNADGEVVALAKNFPLNLAYGTTIHKSQGATLDGARLKLAGLWEAGQAYVALSRVRSSKKLFIDNWNPRSIRADMEVLRFHSTFMDISSPS